MSSNDKGKGIVTAFKVVYNTYDSVQKLMSYLQSSAEEKGDYVCCTDKFLRWNSDKHIHGWAYNSFILLFQNEQDGELENEWYDGAVYVFEVDLSGDEHEEAVVNIARFDYTDIGSWSNAQPSPSNHWQFNHPLHNVDDMIEYEVDNGLNYVGKIKTEGKSKTYRGFQRVSGYYVPLMDITAENAYEVVFGGFDKLRKGTDSNSK
ncbi:MAG: hypothetical protein FWF94_07860 [Oscillospiraceae bacterium]|nr:hypothetical protein [Oscillospiraceae bacterium]